jgi:hypothetical protein
LEKSGRSGYDPAFNVQLATDANSRMIVGVAVTNVGADGGELPPMVDKIREHYGKAPSQALVDSAFATQDAVTAAETAGAKVVSSIPRSEQLLKHGKDPHARQQYDTDEYVAFRARMAAPEYQALYKTRPSIAEIANADCRNRNLRQFRVRGLTKVKAVALWHALAFNFMRLVGLKVLAA